ncbi:serine/threonine protein kinase [Nocardioides sp. TRM66260-LWL]|uniref:serine/threonine-protein kinase n=1 Tax=Nocardioides sp. TRM66260-LWL TaxID=2874478 RepID=UPI001CC672B5|nr:serine/threonine-protein kinase [Nocardioides sp. TRM66260-LWL]MBZ5734736.1 serine/threonine protein kinase [Nocardioides sp. TRM66260-LWL]
MSTTASPRVLGDRYEVGDLIARGGMSEVRRGHDRRLGRDVAIKLLDPHAPDEAARTRFLAEAQVLARLSHPHLVTVLDTGITDDRPWLVMELVPGPTLAAALGDGPLDPERARSVGGALARALAAVHAGGVVHRDVKPANVLLGLDGEQVRLTDFGVARLLDGTADVTRADQTVGTAPYLAPEQLRGERVDGAADVFALGLVLLECLTGRRAYPGSGVEAMLGRLHHAPDVPAHLPAPLVALLREMTDLEPSRRPTAAAVAERLAAAPLPDRPAASTASDGSTRLLTAVAPVAAPPSASTPASERWATIRDRVRAVPEATRALIAVGLALAVVLVVAALARGGSEASTPAPRIPSDASTSTPGSGIPYGVPSRYRDPLTRLHEEVDR